MAKMKIEVEVEGGEARVKLQEIGDAGTQSFEKLKASSVAVGVVIGELAVKALELAARIGKDMVAAAVSFSQAAADDERITRGLVQAMASTGEVTLETAQRYKDLAASMQATLGVSEDDLIPGMSKLITIGKIHESQMQRAAMVAADLAAGLGMDLASAFALVAKGAAGSTEAFGRYGIKIAETGDAARDMEALLTSLESKFRGQAAAAADTFSGKLAIISAGAGEVAESLGGVINGVLTPLVDLFAKATPAIQEFVDAHRPEMIVAFANALSFVADAAVLVVKSGAAIVETYAEVRVMFAQLLEKMTPLIDVWAKINEAIGNDTYAQALRDLSAGLKENTEDQERFAGRVGAATSAITGQAEALRGKLKAGLDAVRDGAGNASAGLEKMVESAKKAAAAGETIGAEYLNTLRKQWADSAKAEDAAYAARLEANRAFNAQVAARSAEVTAKIISDFQKATDAINSTRTAMDISGGEDAERVDIDRKDPAIKAIIERLKASAGRASDLGGEHIKGAIDAIKSGNLTLLENLIKASADQAAVLSRLAAPGAAALGQESKGISQMLASLLMEIRKLLGSPRRAAGGSATGGAPHIVGERGPELFVPSQSGWVMPNNAMSGLMSMPGAVAGAVRQAMAEMGSRPVVVNIDGRQVAAIVNERNARNEGRRF